MTADPMDIYRAGDVYRAERARLAEVMAEPAPAEPDLLVEWEAFGRHGAVWQMFHRKPGSSGSESR